MGELEKIIVQSDIAQSGRDDLSYLDWMKGSSAYCASKAVDVIGGICTVASGLGLMYVSYAGTESLLDKFVGKGEYHSGWPAGGYQNDLIYFLTLVPVNSAAFFASAILALTVGLSFSDCSQKLKDYSYHKLRKPKPNGEIL